MIRFPCHCGQPLEVPAELAGSSVQCPECKRLNDVPTFDDLGHLEDDGTLKLEPFELKEDPHRIQDLKRAFIPQRQDENGEDYDLRSTFEEVAAAGADEVPLALKDQVRPGAPKYDPVTGELVEPMPLKTDPLMKAIPVTTAQPGSMTLNYARRETAEQRRAPAFVELFRPGNFVVMSIVYAMHIAALAILVPFYGGFFIVGVGVLLLYMAIAGHWCNVVQEVGFWERDELPPPMRNVEFWEDILLPFIQFAFAFVVCHYVFSLLGAGIPGPFAKVGFVAMQVLGAFVFPALILTLTSSGSVLNLRPDRFFGVIGACGMRYFFVAGLWAVTLAVYSQSWLGAADHFGSLMRLPVDIPRIPMPKTLLADHWAICLGLLMLSVYMMHLFCWSLGSLYRDFHNQFPWVLQQHISERKLQRVNRRKPRYVAPAPPATTTAARAPDFPSTVEPQGRAIPIPAQAPAADDKPIPLELL